MSINTDPEEWAQPKTEQRVRVYRVSDIVEGIMEPGQPVHFREAAFRLVGDEAWKWVWVTDDWLPLEAKRGIMTEIPLVPFYGFRVAPYRGKPPFLATASLQMSLWRKTLDYDTRERRDARNLLVITG